MDTLHFEPFQDRLSRDIRNELSESIMPVLAQGELAPAQAVADRYLAGELAPCYVDYIRDRLLAYGQALVKVKEKESHDPFTQGLVLWDLGLFFEVHEVLEHAWLKAHGAEKLILQAMIRAAGAYMKQAHGYFEAAAKMAGRAIQALDENRAAWPVGFDGERLKEGLRRLDLEPPRLSA
ncbi:MAG: DUF309 domain-containing protein [Desulfobulbaceae bacterium]|nr:DUF309 domain-containing protein [Desulfobulbaceae bacterium]HIJ79032.1 DUF309 domain-containing protein [Deltaproteobacteria bacterium]